MPLLNIALERSSFRVSACSCDEIYNRAIVQGAEQAVEEHGHMTLTLSTKEQAQVDYALLL